MPTYEYECGNCGARLEKFQKMSDSPLKQCPECHQDSLKKLIGSGAGIIFKGSGFYCTDYKKKPETKTESTPAPGGKSE